MKERIISKAEVIGPVGWGCKIHRLHHCREVKLPHVCPAYDTKQSNGKASIMLKLCRMRCVFLLYLPNPSVRAGYGTSSIFKRSLTGLNSEFSFSLTSCLTKAEEPSLSNYLPIWRESNWIHTFPKGISAMWNAISLNLKRLVSWFNDISTFLGYLIL